MAIKWNMERDYDGGLVISLEDTEAPFLGTMVHLTRAEADDFQQDLQKALLPTKGPTFAEDGFPDEFPYEVFERSSNQLLVRLRPWGRLRAVYVIRVERLRDFFEQLRSEVHKILGGAKRLFDDLAKPELAPPPPEPQAPALPPTAQRKASPRKSATKALKAGS